MRSPETATEDISHGFCVFPVYDIPQVPDNLTELSDKGLMRLFSRYVGWENYLAARVVTAEISERMAEEELKRLEAMFMAAHMTGRKVTEVRAERDALQDEGIANAREVHTNAWALRKAHTMTRDSVARTGALVSREITRRGNMSNLDYRQQARNA